MTSEFWYFPPSYSMMRMLKAVTGQHTSTEDFSVPLWVLESLQRGRSQLRLPLGTDIGGSCSWELPTPHGHWWWQVPLWKPSQFFSIGPPGDPFFFFFNIYLFWPYQVLVVALRIFNLVFVATCHQNTWTLSYSMWALVPCRDQTQGP